jgi:hypothetical protein
MSTKSKIAALAAVIAFVAAPALAGDQNLATELQDSGRYVAQVTVPSAAYASARKTVRVQAPVAQSQAIDFQLVGHN